MANDGNWDNQYEHFGFEWQDESQSVDQAHVLEAIDGQQSRIELPSSNSPHPAFQDAAQMAQFAYAAYVRAQEQMQAASRQLNTNGNANANRKTTFRWDLVEEAQATLPPVKHPKTGTFTAPTPPIRGAQAPPAPPAAAPPPQPFPAPIGPPVATSASISATTPMVDLRSPNGDKKASSGMSQLPFAPPPYHSRPIDAKNPSVPKLPYGSTPPYQDASIHSSTSHFSPQPHPPPPPPQLPHPPATTSKSKRKSVSKSTPKSSARATPPKPDTSKTEPRRAGGTPQQHSPKTHPEPQVVIPPSPVKMAPPKRRGRPKKNPQVEIIPPAPKVHYPVFRCHWEDCQSELHNLNSLESHLLQKHIPYSVVCKWEGCRDEAPKAAAAMYDHAHLAHLAPVAWKFGDGPKVPITGENKDIPAFEVLLPPSGI